MNVTDAEFAGRRDAFADVLSQRGLAGAVLFEPHYVYYYSGFYFIPTERPIAFALAADGRGGMLVPRLELEHARANTAVSEIAHYDEYPGREHDALSAAQPAPSKGRLSTRCPRPSIASAPT